MPTFDLLTETTMTDHEFARWLRSRGWTGKTSKELEIGKHRITAFLTDGNDLLAKVVYDNEAATKRIFT